MKRKPPTPEPPESEIQHLAYMLWLESGRQPGHDLDNWLAARELLRRRYGRTETSRRPRPTPPPPPVTEPARPGDN